MLSNGFYLQLLISRIHSLFPSYHLYCNGQILFILFSLCTSLLFLLVLITIMYFVFFGSLFICTSNWILIYVSGGPYLLFYRFIYVNLSYSVDVIYVISFDGFIIVNAVAFVNTFFKISFYFFIFIFPQFFFLFFASIHQSFLTLLPAHAPIHSTQSLSHHPTHSQT